MTSAMTLHAAVQGRQLEHGVRGPVSKAAFEMTSMIMIQGLIWRESELCIPEWESWLVMF